MESSIKVEESSNNIVFEDREEALKIFKERLNDKMLEIQLWVERQEGFGMKRKCIVMHVRESLRDFSIEAIVEEEREKGWEVTEEYTFVKGVALDKKECTELRKVLRVTNQDNEKKIVALGNCIKNFITKYEIYGKSKERVMKDWLDLLLIYPIKYTQRILRYKNFKQKELPTLGEVEELIRYTDSYNSQAYYDINNANFEDAIDYEDEF